MANQFNPTNPYGIYTSPGFTGAMPPGVQSVTTPAYIQANQPQSSLVWVNGEEGAVAYPVARGNTILLLDTQDSKFYLKSMDLIGTVSIRKFRFEELVDSNPNPSKEANSLPKEEVNTITQLSNSIESISASIGNISERLGRFEQETVEQMRFMEDKINRIDNKPHWKTKTKREDKVENE